MRILWGGLDWTHLAQISNILWTQYWISGPHQMLGNSLVATQLAVSQEELSSAESVHSIGEG
jgi:hypothetical protein